MPTLKQRIGKIIIQSLPISKELFDQLRLEINATYLRTSNSLNHS